MNQKDLKRYRKMLEHSRQSLLDSAKKTLMEESNFDTDDLPDEIDLASSEYAQSMVFRLRDREKALHWLGVAIDRREDVVLHLPTYPEYDWLRDDPAFSRLLVRAGLPPR